MAELTADEVRALAATMARLELTEEEAATIAKDMAGILEHLAALRSVDVSEIELGDSGASVLRDDVRSTPDHGGFDIIVPKVVE